MNCPQCDAINRSSRNYCGKCGARLYASSDSESSRSFERSSPMRRSSDACRLKSEKSARNGSGHSAKKSSKNGRDSASSYSASRRQSSSGRSSKQVYVPNYMAFSVAAAIFCCLPLGIAAIVFSAQVGPKLVAGDIAGAQDASDRAKLLSIASIVLGVIAVCVAFFAGLFSTLINHEAY